MAPIFCTSRQCLLKAGKGRSSDWNTSGFETDINDLISEAESFINDASTINFSDTYSTLNADLKKILEDTASSHAAMAMIEYDMSGYSDLAEAQTMEDVLYTRIQDNIKLLKEKQHSKFIT